MRRIARTSIWVEHGSRGDPRQVPEFGAPPQARLTPRGGPGPGASTRLTFASGRLMVNHGVITPHAGGT